MKQHLATEQFNAYAQQRMSPVDLMAADAHLAECAVCRNKLEALLPASAFALHAELQLEAASLSHLSFEQIAAFADDALNHAETLAVRDHLATCRQCAAEANDLREFAATDEHTPTLTTHSPSAWERFRAWLTVPSVGWAMAALLVVVLAGWMLHALWQRPAETPQIAKQEVTPTPLPVLSPVPATPEAAPLLAQLNDGGKPVSLDQQGQLAGLETLSAAQQQLVKAALTAQKLERSSALADLQRRGSSLMGSPGNKDDEGNKFALQSPVAKVVLNERPTLKWSPLAGATSYVVEIYDEQFNLIAQSEALTQTQWTPPRPLARGKVFAWQVKATKDGQAITAPAPPAPQARFRVITNSQAAEISQAKQAGSHLSLTVLYVQAGLLDEAETELRTLRQANPQAELIRRWQSQVQAMRH